MKLVLIRHAAAIERGPGITEANRYLTPEGREFFRKTARTMRDRDVAPDLILTSPFLRAVQTADILAETLAFNGPLIALEELCPGCSLATIKPLVNRFSQVKELVMVGHEPDLGDMVGELLGLPHGFTFKKGSAVRVNVSPADLSGGAVFKWLASGRKLVTSREVAGGV